MLLTTASGRLGVRHLAVLFSSSGRSGVTFGRLLFSFFFVTAESISQYPCMDIFAIINNFHVVKVTYYQTCKFFQQCISPIDNCYTGVIRGKTKNIEGSILGFKRAAINGFEYLTDAFNLSAGIIFCFIRETKHIK